MIMIPQIGQRWLRINYAFDANYIVEIVELPKLPGEGYVCRMVVSDPRYFYFGARTVCSGFPGDPGVEEEYWEYLEGQDKPLS